MNTKNTNQIITWLLVLFLLAGCGANPKKVYCSTIATADAKCRKDDGKGAKANEEHLDAVNLPPNTIGIYTDPFQSGKNSELITGMGYHSYPEKYTITIPTNLIQFKTEPYPCDNETKTCTGSIDNINVVYTVNGVTQTRIIGVDLTASLTFNVNSETKLLWILIVGDAKNASAAWFTTFWNDFRFFSRTLNLGEYDLPADNGGEESRQKIAEAMKNKFTTGLNAWKYSSTFTLSTFGIRQLYLNNETARAGYSQGSTTSVDAQATQAAESVFNAQMYATQQAIICQGVNDPVACALLMLPYKGDQVSVIVQPQQESTPTPTSTPAP
jgi:hypothetical protein